MDPASLPRSLGAFRIEAVLGEGGSGIVYDATWGPRRVALKVMHEALAGAERVRAQFLSEAQRLQTIAHPSVVKVLAVGQLPDGRPYLAMERLDGETLAQVLGRGPLPLAKALELFGDLCVAVATLHEQGLVHRDLKPENVFIVGGVHAVLLDFGIAKELAAPASTTTMDGGVRGTPAYMAPERFFGQPAGVATDVYELAVILYAMLAGRLPWDDLGDPEARLSPRPLVELAHVPEELDVAIRRALSTRAQNRPATAIALRDAVGHAAGSGAPPTAAETARMAMTIDPASAPRERSLGGGSPRRGRPTTIEPPPVNPTTTADRKPWFAERHDTTDRGKTPLAWMPTNHATPPEPARRSSRTPWILGTLAVIAVGGGGVLARRFAGDAPAEPVAAAMSTTPAPTIPAPAPSEDDPWAAKPSPAPEALPQIEVTGSPITLRQAQAELDKALLRLPPDTTVVLAATVARLRADERFEGWFTRLREAPQAALFGDLVPHCIKQLVAYADWAAVGSPGFSAADTATLLIRGRFDRDDVDACFELTNASVVHAYLDDHTVYVTIRDDLTRTQLEGFIAKPPGLPRNLRAQLAKLPADRMITWAVDGASEWPNRALPDGSDSWGWLRATKDGIATALAFDVKDEAAAKSLEASLRPPLATVFEGATEASGRLDVTRAKSEVKISGTVSWLMMSLAIAALK